MSTARKYASNPRSMSETSRRHCYAAINILWNQMRPDLRFENKEIIREERLAWITSFLNLARPLESTTKLTDGQIGLLLDEMRRMTGTKSEPKPQFKGKSGNVVQLSDYKKTETPTVQSDAKIEHLAGEAQIFTINKLVGSIGWSEEGFRDFLFKKFQRRSPRMLSFKKANSLMMILLNIAADKELRGQGKTKITRKMTADYIPTLKLKLDIK